MLRKIFVDPTVYKEKDEAFTYFFRFLEEGDDGRLYEKRAYHRTEEGCRQMLKDYLNRLATEVSCIEVDDA